MYIFYMFYFLKIIYLYNEVDHVIPTNQLSLPIVIFFTSIHFKTFYYTHIDKMTSS